MIDGIYRRFFIHFNTYYAWSAFPGMQKQTLGEVETKTLI